MRVRTAGFALGLLCLSWAVVLWVEPWSDERVSDLYVYRQFAATVLDGAVPYRDAFLEYPPLAAPILVLPGLAGTGEEAYRLAFAAMALVLAAIVLLLTGALAARTGGEPRRAMVAAGLAPLLCGAMIRTHFDLAPVAITLAALLLLCTGRPRGGLALLGVGVMTKGFPLVVAPVALAWLVARGSRRAALQGGLALALVVAGLSVVALAASPSGAADAVTYHVERPVQVESVPAGVLLVLDGVGAGEALPVKSHRSDGLEHPAAGILGGAFAVALLLTVLLAAWTGARGAPPDERRLVLASLTAVAAFAVLGKVVSPQFLIWVVPLGALALAWRMHALAALCAAAAALTLAEFPSRYFDVVEREPLALGLVTARNVVLLCVVALAIRTLSSASRRRGPGADRSTPPTRSRALRPAPR